MEQFSARGFTVLGFPCNQFGSQEPGSDAEILEFATSRYQASFPLFSKIEVNGDNAAPLYKLLRKAAPEPDGSEALPWNFTKFLVGRDGTVIKRYSPKATPEEIGRELADYL